MRTFSYETNNCSRSESQKVGVESGNFSLAPSDEPNILVPHVSSVASQRDLLVIIMVKVKVIDRPTGQFVRETKNDLHRIHRNYDPSLHPFEAAREYQRALNTVKLDRMFAKPFLGALTGHHDIVTCMTRHPTSLSYLLSASADGVVKLWNVATKKCVRSVIAHQNQIVRSICTSNDSNYFFTVDSNASIRKWKLDDDEDESNASPITTVLGSTPITGMDHHWKQPYLMTVGEKLELWEENRSEPLRSFTWGADSGYCVKCNPVEVNIVAASAGDNSITLYDVRRPLPLRRVVLEMRTNQIAWNPMEAFIMATANEDSNLYSFDMRNLKKALQVHMDHTSAVTSVDYSPTGAEFVSGSYDKSIRLFSAEHGHSHEIYHTKRMQRVSSVLFTSDAKYILSGSNEMDIRIWKSKRSEKLGIKSYREEANFKYQEKLKEKFAHFPQVKRIARNRHIPKHILHGQKEKREMLQSKKRKETNRRNNSRPGTVPFTDEKAKHIVREDE